MDLKVINKEYADLKQSLEKTKQDIEDLEKNLIKTTEDKAIVQGEMLKAKRRGDKDAVENCEEQIKIIDDEIKAIKDEATKLKEEKIVGIQRKINERIEQIKQDPDMKRHLESVMATKYNRKIKKLESERDEFSNKKIKLETIKALVETHPTLENNIKGMLSAQGKMNELKEEEKQIKAQGRAAGFYTADQNNRLATIASELLNMKNKYNVNKSNLTGYLQKNNINVEEKDILDLANTGIIANKQGQIDLKAMINKNIKMTDRQINGYNKQIKNYEIALGENAITRTQPQGQGGPTGPGPQGGQTQTTGKTSWWQAIKNKFKSWREGRKQQALPQNSTESQVDTEYRKNNNNRFKDSLKYDIVKDTVEQIEKEELKEASRERRSSGHVR